MMYTQIIFIIGGALALIGSHVFFKKRPVIENTIDNVIEKVVESTTSIDLSSANKTLDNLVDAVEKNMNIDEVSEKK